MTERRLSAKSQRGPRHRARRCALQALYQWQVTQQEAAEILEQFHAEQDMSRVDTAYFDELVRRVAGSAVELDESLAPFLDRPMAQVDGVERAVLRLAAWELRHNPGVPWRVVLDEAVELAHEFGASHGHGFVNAVLDHAARAWREGRADTDPGAPADR